jgi:hypothetical protein
MAVDIGAGPSVTAEAGVPRPLFQTSLNPSPQLGEYAVTPDGERFLMVERLGGKTEAVTLLLNWRPLRVRSDPLTVLRHPSTTGMWCRSAGGLSLHSRGHSGEHEDASTRVVDHQGCRRAPAAL